MHLARARTLHRCVRRHDAVPLTADGRRSAEEFIVVPTKRVASYFSELLDLKIFEPPVPMRSFTIDLLGSVARSTDPALRWLRNQVLHICSEGTNSSAD